jgi:hypothetical protein
MSSSGKSPNVFGIPATLQWCVGSIEQLKGQVWGLIQNGGGGGGGTQDLQSVLSYGNSAFNQSIILEGNDYSQITISGTPDSSYVELVSPNSTNGIFLFVNDSSNYLQFYTEGGEFRLQLEPSGPIVSTERVKIPVDATFPLGESGILLLSDFLGVANGIATLDSSGLVPVTQLPFSATTYQGTWDATNPPVGGTPTLSDASIEPAGNFYFVSVGGTQDLGSGNITFDAGDVVVSNGSIWEKVGTPVPTTQKVESRPDAAYQLVLTDNQKLLKFPFSTGRNITVPLNATVAFPVGSRVDIMMTNDGQATFVGETVGVLILSKGGNKKTNGKYTVVSIEKIATDEWVLVGDLTS